MQKTTRKKRFAPGFSIVELVVIIVLLGIVGAVIIPRFVAPNSFNDNAAQDGLITTIRAAQQASLGRTSVTFEVNDIGDEWEFVAKESTSELRRFEVPESGLVLETGTAAASTDTCATGGGDFDTPVGADFQLAFGEKGDLSSFTYNLPDTSPVTEVVNTTFNGVRICINNVDALSVCVSPAGYAYAGKCDD